MNHDAFFLQAPHYHAAYCPQTMSLAVTCGGKTWTWTDQASIRLKNGRVLRFQDAACTAKETATPVMRGVKATYSNFPQANFTIDTFVGIDEADGAMRMELTVIGDETGEIEFVYWPAPFAFDIPEGRGYSVLPLFQGVLLPSRWAGSVPVDHDERINTRHAYLPMWGQVDEGRGYLAIFHTPFDARMHYGHEPNGKTEITPYWETSLGHIGTRQLRCYFYESCDYVTLAKQYRAYSKEIGRFVSLKEKIARNPNVAYLIGSPIVHSGIAVHIDRKSHYYTEGAPEKNDYFTPFDQRASELCALHAKGVDQAYLHLDGWGCHGYDNLHPFPFPVHEAAGGADGMKRLSDTCRELGYRFGIHDQYRDFYYDSPAYSEEQCVENIDGTHPYCDIWYGGAHSWLCAELAPDYVRRCYTEFDRLGIQIDGSYLDVFSVAELDECFNPHHRMTREQCAQSRREALGVLTSRGIITSSEEVADTIVPAMDLCHHAPLAVDSWDGPSNPIGVPIPLFALVYHDSIVVPWFGIDHNGGCLIPSDRSGFLCALQTGGTIYFDINETPENIEKGRDVLELHRRTALCELTNHRFTDDTYLRQESTFADGTTVYIDFETGDYRITYGA